MFRGMDKHSKTASFLQSIPASMEKPSALLIVSAHWETDKVSIQTNPKPSLYYDYGGFPDEFYHLTWNTRGITSPLLSRVESLLNSSGFEISKDSKRGYDHGTFVPMMLSFPEPDFPVFHVLLNSNYQPEYHIKLGQALSPLTNEGVLIIGSGEATHNLGEFFRSKDMSPPEWTKAFDEWLTKTATAPPEERIQRVLDVESAPYFRKAHPQEDHLVPFYVIAGVSAPEVMFKDGRVTGSNAAVDESGAAYLKRKVGVHVNKEIQGSISLSCYRFD
jgi:aromatic ring-opening dioxygenase catalytic subunit (LigB family)